MLGGVSVGLFYLLGRFPSFVESVYSRGLYAGIRWVWDYSLGFSPIPLVYICAAGLIVWMVIALIRRRRKNRSLQRPWWKKILYFLSFIGAAAGALTFFFYFLWGFNYARIPLEKKLDLNPRPLSVSELKDIYLEAVHSAAETRASVPRAGEESLEGTVLKPDLEQNLRRRLVDVLREMEYPAPGRVRARIFRPGGWMMRFSVAGMYVPFLGEGYVSRVLLPFERPFGMAHEMVHGYGFTEEGTANFLAYLACSRSDDPLIRYSGALEYWMYAARECRRAVPKEYAELAAVIPPGIRSDLVAISKSRQKYRGRLSQVGREINDRYLKSQGVREGVLSYNRLLVLVRAWREKYPLEEREESPGCL